MSKRIFHKNYSQSDLYRAKEVLAIFTTEVRPDEEPNEVLWQKYKQTRDDRVVLQYIVNNRGYFIVFLANFFNSKLFSGDPRPFATALFEGVRNAFRKSDRYVKSYIARGVRFELLRTEASLRKVEEESIDEHAFEDESIDETTDRLYHENIDYDYIAVFNVVREVIEKNPKLPPSRLRKLIIKECKRRGVYLSLYEYLQTHDLRLP